MKRGIDHLVLCVSDLDRAIALYRDLGFVTTPRAQHPWGTDNSLIQLQGCFLELLTVSRPELIEPAGERFFSFGAFSQQFLERRQGMSMLVFESSDACADRKEFAARGLYQWDLFDFQRQAKLPDGSSVSVAFSLAFATDARMPEVAFFCCQQHAPQYFWKSEYQRHPNGAETIDKVVMAAAEPEIYADFFSKVQEPESVVVDSEALTVATPRGHLLVVTPETARRCFGGVDYSCGTESPSFFGFSVRVPALDGVADILDANGVGFTSTDEAIRIHPEEAFGVAIEFTARPGGK